MLYDCLINGAGAAGLSLACALKTAGRSVLLVDRQPLGPTYSQQTHPATGRVYALSKHSKNFLTTLKVWQRLDPAQIQPVQKMRIQGKNNHSLHFQANVLQQPALAWMVDEFALQEALRQTLMVSPAIDFLAPVEPIALTFAETATHLHLEEGPTISTRLLVGADGAQSWVRQQADIPFTKRDYQQIALTGRFQTERPHQETAYQWFLPDGGIIAYLPLPGQTISLVWSAPRAQGEMLQRQDSKTIAQLAAVAGNWQLGQLKLLDKKCSGFPLSAIQVDSPVALNRRIALIGDAAHRVHPLAGQGINLGLHDTQLLADLLNLPTTNQLVQDWGNPLLLARYRRLQQNKTFPLAWGIDLLWHLSQPQMPLQTSWSALARKELFHF